MARYLLAAILIATASAPALAQVNVTWKLAVGQELYVETTMNRRSEFVPPGDKPDVEVEETTHRILTRLKILKKRDDRGYEVEHHFLGFNVAGDPDSAKHLEKVAGAKIIAQHDARFAVTKLVDYEQFLLKLADNNIIGRAIIGLTFDEPMMRFLVGHSLGAAPGKPVQPGDTWKDQVSLSFMSMADFKLNRTYTLAGSTKENPALQRINLGGTVDFKVKKAPPWVPLAVGFEISTGETKAEKFEGNVLFDTEQGLMTRSTMLVETKSSLTFKFKEGEVPIKMHTVEKTVVEVHPTDPENPIEHQPAIRTGLKWLAAQQADDGGWRFEHQETGSRNKATAMALLAFLGTRQTHQEGEYRQSVDRGIKFLLKNAKDGAKSGRDYRGGGQLDSHAWTTLALCEAYASTADKELAQHCQDAIYFTETVQNETEGGWGSAPNGQGNTVDLAFHMLALFSGHLAYLEIRPATIARARKFLKQTSLENGAFYGLTKRGKRPLPTSAGLLATALFDENTEPVPGSAVGLKYVVGLGPSDDMLFNFLATQVVWRLGDDEAWYTWRERLRNRLVKLQAPKGYWRQSKDSKTGRIYNTALALMCLEVHYPCLPLNLKRAW